MAISNNDFEPVRKRLQAGRVGDDERGCRRVPTDAEDCLGCGSRLLVVRTASGHRYYRCSAFWKGDISNEACRALVRVPDLSIDVSPTASSVEEVAPSKEHNATKEVPAPDEPALNRVHLIFRLVSEGWSLARIAAHLDEMSISTGCSG